MLPPLPEWDAIHPLVVHFPIALLFVSPIFMAIAVIVRKPAWVVSAGIVLVLGTIGAWVAYYSGEAGEAYWRTHGELSDEVDLLLSRHHVAGGQARLLATVSVLAFGAWGATALATRKHRAVIVAIGALIIVGHLGVILRLAQAAHMGGVLVHEHRLTAPLGNDEF